ncbi:hypothetical protein [Flaviaesturariibacter amylovorans]|uniref:DUF1735 domain-containing protein n=1 Tax=Flaviaesturariibacter amylovorans TaxID=1084520 RepID=A0ABP8H1H4_9BACT
MKNILKIGALALLLAGCNKDKFQTKPQLKLISVSNNPVDLQSLLQLDLEFTDKEGDVTDSIFVTKVWKNRTQNNPVASMKLEFSVPDFPKTQSGRIIVGLSNPDLQAASAPRNQTGTPYGKETDTLDLRIVVKDAQDNKSDTLVVPNIYVFRS